jgi:1-deoxy-D-xylulose-5-phosphate synthase
MLEFALTLKGRPSSIRYPRSEAYRLASSSPIELGRSEVVVEGRDVCIMAVGSMVKTALASAKLLSASGISACVINARFIKPLDEEMLRRIAGDFSLLMTVEEGVLDCGFGSAVKEFYEQAGLIDKVNIISAGLPGIFIPAGKRDFLLKTYGLDATSLSVKIRSILESKPVRQK